MSTYVVVQLSLGVDIIIDNMCRPDTAIDILEEISRLGSTNTISTVNIDGRQDRFSLHQGLESVRKLGVVTFLSGLTIGITCSLSVEASNQVMKLRGCFQTEIGRLCTSSVETILQGSNEGSAAWSKHSIRVMFLRS